MLGAGCEDGAAPPDAGAPPAREARPEGRAPGTLSCQVRSTPPGARVLVDGVDVGQATPATVVLPVGRPATIAVRAPGFLGAQEALEADLRRCPELDFALRPGVTLAVETRPPGAEVRVDGRLVLAATPGRTEPLPPGRLAVNVHREGSVDVFRTVAAPDAGVVRLELELRPAAIVALSGTPPGAQVLVDGQPTAFRLPADVTLTPGARHRLTVTLPGWAPVTRVVTTGPAGSRGELEVALEDQQRAALQRRVDRAEKALTVARKALGQAQAREEASELQGRTRPALVEALEQAYQAVQRAQNELDEAEAGRDAYDVLHPQP